MCVRHWRLVPSDTQRKVYSTWRAVRHSKGSHTDMLLAIKTYREVRDTAVATAHAAQLAESPLC